MPTSSFLLFLFLSIASPSHSLSSDGLALLALRSAVASDPYCSLLSWSPSDPNPCFWPHVLCSPSHRVVSLNLRGLRLSSYLNSELLLLSSLSLLDLSSNHFSGPLPQFLPSLPNLSGTLNFSFNSFSGDVPPSYGSLPVRVSLDLSHNNLSGRIPLVGSLLSQGPTAFQSNPGLCGFPLQNPCPLLPGDSSSGNRPVDPTDSGFLGSNGRTNTRGSAYPSHVLPVITGVLVAVAAAVCWSILVLRRRRRRNNGGYGDAIHKVIIESGGSPGSNVDDDRESEGQKGKYVVVDEGFELEMEELLRASAYMVGKSRGGIVYKVVVMGGGTGQGESVAVRRLSEGEYRWGFKEFEAEVEAISRVVHPNVVRLRAYYNADDEKLLVTEFVRNGSLHSALHGTADPLSPVIVLKLFASIHPAICHVFLYACLITRVSGIRDFDFSAVSTLLYTLVAHSSRAPPAAAASCLFFKCFRIHFVCFSNIEAVSAKCPPQILILAAVFSFEFLKLQELVFFPYQFKGSIIMSQCT